MDSQLTGITNKVSLFGKSFNNIVRDYNNGLGKTTSLFSKTVTKNDVTCITNFMNQLKAGTPIGKAWSNTMTGATTAGKQMAVQVKSGAVSLDTLTSSANTSKVALIGMRVASMALNMTLSMGIAYGIQKLIELFTNLANAADNAAEAAREQVIEYQDIADACEEESTSLSELIQKYKELAESGTRDASTNAEIRDIQNQIVGLVGEQANGLDLVNGKLDTQINKLNQISDIQNQNTVNAYRDLYNSSISSVGTSLKAEKNVGWNSWYNPLLWGDKVIAFDDNTGFDYYGDSTRREILKAIDAVWKEKGYGSASEQKSGFGSYTALLLNNDLTNKEVSKALGLAIDAVKNTIPSEELSDNAIYKKLTTLKNDLFGNESDYYKGINALNRIIDLQIQSAVNNKDYSNVNTVDKYLTYRDDILAQMKEDSSIKTALQQGDITKTEILNRVNSYLSGIEELSGLYDKANKQESIDSTLKTVTQNLKKQYNSDIKKQTVQQWIDGLSDTDKELVYDIAINTDTANYTLQDWINALENSETIVPVSFDIATEEAQLESFNDILSDAASDTGITDATMESINTLYSALLGGDTSELYDYTANGIKLNTEAVKELQSVYESINKADLDSTLKKLRERYEDLTTEINDCSDATERNALGEERDKIADQIENVEKLATQYDGLTSAYSKWKQALEGEEAGSMYDSIRDSLEDIQELYKNGLVGTEEFRTYVDLLSNEDLSTASVDAIIEAYDKLNKTIDGTSYKATDFLKEDSAGVQNLLYAINELNSAWASQDENGNWTIDFGEVGNEGVAKALGIDVEFLESALSKLTEYGFDIDLDAGTESVENLVDRVRVANEELKKLEKTDVTFNVESQSIDDVKKQIKSAKKIMKSFKDDKGKINVKAEGYEEASLILSSLIRQKQTLEEKPAIMKVAVEENTKSDAEKAILYLQQLYDEYNDYKVNVEIGADTSENEKKIGNLKNKLDKLPDTVKTALKIDTSKLNLKNIKAKIKEITPDMIVEAGVDATKVEDYNPDDETATVKYNVDKTAVDNFKSQNHDKTATLTYNVKTNGKAKVDGTAHLLGTAYSKGNWGTKNSGTALGGELGQELLVRNGRFFTIGDNSAEFFNYKKGDIIFNAAQTEQIFKYGKILSGSSRGKAFAEGTAFALGSTTKGGGSFTSNAITTAEKANNSSNSSDTKSTEKETSDSDDFKETFDWIEIAIERLERAISRLDLKSSSVYKKWGTRNKALIKQIGKVEDEITLQEKAYSRYMQQANSVGLSESWKAKVRNGEVDINTITDENLADKIQEYENWYNKALACKDTIQDLKETEAELYKQSFDNVISKYDGILSVVEHEKSMLEEFITQSEAKGQIISTKYYDALIDNENKKQKKLTNQKTKLQQKLNEAVASGKIKEGSEAWYDMVEEIDNVTLAIEESETAVLEYAKSIQEIKWENFDLLQERISAITEEADFLIDLLDNNKLYDDRGQFTNEGMAVMGLHGQNYNVHMNQADRYAKELKKLDKQIAADPYNQDLINRRAELLKLQQDSISAAESEKQAIIDMVEEGINLELEALQELITTYTDALDAQKDLYDYQQKISESTKELANLEKQLSAYEGDDSEETKAKIQQLKVDLEEANANLEETEYEKYISDQKELLDNLYDEYEEILNTRLDNIDALFAEMIETANTNATTISNTITTEASSVGYTLSTAMSSIWDETTPLTTYGEGILTQVTGVNDAVNDIKLSIKNAKTNSNTQAKKDVKTAKNSSESKNKDTKKKTTNKKDTKKKVTDTKVTKDSGNNKAEIGDKVTFVSGLYHENSYGGGLSGYHNRGGTVYITGINTKGTHPYHISTGKTMGSGDLGWLKLSQLKGYASGKHNLLEDEYAWTQENNKSEMIIRRSDGAILTPLAKQDSVLNAQASNNIWNMANNPSEFIRDNLNVNDINIPDNIGSHNTYTQILDKVVFNLPNVKNYDEFLNALQNDKDFERLITAITLDQIAGKSTLLKGKAIRK